MRNTPNLRIERFRQRHPALGDSQPGENWGFFVIPRPSGVLRVLVSDGTEDNEKGWEHVSVSLAGRRPNWDEMAAVKELWWHDEETVFQFHPAKSQYVNAHPHVLHLWRKRNSEIELPPTYLIAPERAPSDVETIEP